MASALRYFCLGVFCTAEEAQLYLWDIISKLNKVAITLSAEKCLN